jgi:hypothetical protein
LIEREKSAVLTLLQFLGIDHICTDNLLEIPASDLLYGQILVPIPGAPGTDSENAFQFCLIEFQRSLTSQAV